MSRRERTVRERGALVPLPNQTAAAALAPNGGPPEQECEAMNVVPDFRRVDIRVSRQQDSSGDVGGQVAPMIRFADKAGA